ncbi:MAG: hypothetical protein U5K74_11470 [Gemmatimonadaceae bacterium]|nr:hypothetical protein [Gemmatimonadaceae bacterium]
MTSAAAMDVPALVARLRSLLDGLMRWSRSSRPTLRDGWRAALPPAARP